MSNCTDKELVAIAAARLVVRALLAGERVKHVKWICEYSNERIGFSVIAPDGSHLPFERILVRFEDGYEDGVRYVAGPMLPSSGGPSCMSFGEPPHSIGDFNPFQDWDGYEKYDDAVAEVVADFFQCSFTDVEIPLTVPDLSALIS